MIFTYFFISISDINQAINQVSNISKDPSLRYPSYFIFYLDKYFDISSPYNYDKLSNLFNSVVSILRDAKYFSYIDRIKFIYVSDIELFELNKNIMEVNAIHIIKIASLNSYKLSCNNINILSVNDIKIVNPFIIQDDMIFYDYKSLKNIKYI